MSMKTMEELFVDKLKDIHDAERRITRALPKMIRSASSEDLSEALQDHLQVTEGQIDRLDRIFESLGKTPGRKTCHGMIGLLEEGEELMGKESPEPLMDAALIGAAQGVEHYEIAAYGCLKTWAEVLGKPDAAKLLQQSLEEEEDADKKLTELATSINSEALQAGESEESEEEEMTAAGRRGNGPRGGNGSSRSARGRSKRS